jgi:hypothetical protein
MIKHNFHMQNQTVLHPAARLTPTPLQFRQAYLISSKGMKASPILADEGGRGHKLDEPILPRHNQFAEVLMLAYLFLVLAIVVRFLPHPWTFTPVVGALLFFGARAQGRVRWVPVALLAISDLALNRFVWAYKFSWDQLLIWGWYAAMVWLGTKLYAKTGVARVLGAALAGSVSFFLVSNFGVWAATNMYPKTFAGILTCYTAALPFFRNALEGDLIFTSLMFALPGILSAFSSASHSRDRAAA